MYFGGTELKADLETSKPWSKEPRLPGQWPGFELEDFGLQPIDGKDLFADGATMSTEEVAKQTREDLAKKLNRLLLAPPLAPPVLEEYVYQPPKPVDQRLSFELGGGLSFNLAIEVVSVRLISAPWDKDLDRPIAIDVVFRAPDRNGQGMVEISYQERVPTYLAYEYEKKAWASWLRDVLTRMVAHEIAEGIYLDGTRVFEPHT